MTSLLEEHVARFQRGCRTGDWSAMLELFAPDAELIFEGVPVGPFRGRATRAGELRLTERGDRIARLVVTLG